ncbi:MAG: hypothetical protein D6798_19805 [Deltaproteobacteria bacterium]|nr:MAG: hypothetical protein D6798_19805 [Deltaproteobacteria bacterium]
MLLWMLIACTTDGGALAGDWIAAFYRTGPDDAVVEGDGSVGGSLPDTADTAAPADTGTAPLPACEGDTGAEHFRAFLRITHTVPIEGEHLTLYPDSGRHTASNATDPSSAMGGLVVGDWQGGVARLDLVPDLDSALVTNSDREAWRTHHLALQGQAWGDRCWSARWAWVDAEGIKDDTERGIVFLRRQ